MKKVKIKTPVQGNTEWKGKGKGKEVLWKRDLELACSKEFWEGKCGINIWEVRKGREVRNKEMQRKREVGNKMQEGKKVHRRKRYKDAWKYAVGGTSSRHA